MDDKNIKSYTLVTVTLGSFLTPFMGSALNLAIPVIGEQMHSTTLLLSWVASSYLLTSAAFLLPLGRLADIIGRKKVFIWGLGLFSITSLLCALARSMPVLIAVRSLQGAAGSAVFGTSMAILSSVFPPQERGKVLGINIGTVYVGLSLGPSLGGIMTYHLGWESIFLFTSAISAVAFGLAVTRLKGEWSDAKSEPYDFAGAVLYIFGLTAFLYGISSIAASTLARYFLLIGIIALASFVLVELHSKHPLLNLRLFKNITFAFSNLAALINYSATFAVGFILSLYLQVVRGYDAQAAGMIMLIQPAIQAILSPYAGALSDRVDSRILASWGMAITTAGLLVFSYISPDFPIWLVAANLALLGIGFGLFSSPNSNAIMGSVDRKFYGVASSTLATMRTVGQAISMAVVTLILTLHLGDTLLVPALSAEFVLSARTACLVFTIICGGGIFASLARGKTVREEHERRNV